jgi:hypothetical protein
MQSLVLCLVLQLLVMKLVEKMMHRRAKFGSSTTRKMAKAQWVPLSLADSVGGVKCSK